MTATTRPAGASSDLGRIDLIRARREAARSAWWCGTSCAKTALELCQDIAWLLDDRAMAEDALTAYRLLVERMDAQLVEARAEAERWRSTAQMRALFGGEQDGR